MKRTVFLGGLALLVTLPLAAQPVNAYGEWRAMGHDIARTGYAPGFGYIANPVLKWNANPVSGGDGSAVAGDIDADGFIEPVCGNLSNSNCYSYNGATGAQKWGYIVGTVWGFATPALADVDGDGQDEVVYMWRDGGSTGYLLVLDGATGAVKQSRTYPGENLESSIVVADVNADGVMEIVFKGPSVVHVVSGTNINNTVWTATVGGSQWGSPSIADVDADGALEVVVHGTQVYRLNGATGAVEGTFAVIGAQRAPTLVQLDADPQLEILVASGSVLYCVDGLTMTQQWSYSAGTGTLYHTGGVADVDGDGSPEIVFGTGAPAGVLHCLNADGTLQWTWAGATDYYFWSAPVALGDIDNDGVPEIVTANWDDWVRAHRGTDGALLWAYNYPGQPNNITFADIDADSCLEVLVEGKAGSWLRAIDDATDPNCSPNAIDVKEGETFRLRYTFTPVGGGVVVEVSGVVGPVRVRLYDAMGRLRRSAAGFAGRYEFSGLGAGVYVARLTAGDRAFAGKFVVTR